jgi:hypothetical protein
MAETFFAQPFFVNIILPFIFTFVLLYALMEKANLLNNKQAHLLLALAISFFFVGVPSLINITQIVIPVVTILVIIAFCLMLLYGAFGVEWYVPGKPHALKGWVGAILTIVGIIVVAFSLGIKKFLPPLSPEMINTIAFIVIAGVVIFIIVKFSAHPAK